jgi:hypothetical protein
MHAPNHVKLSVLRARLLRPPRPQQRGKGQLGGPQKPTLADTEQRELRNDRVVFVTFLMA